MGRYSVIRQEWTGLIEQWRVSGLSGVEFCRREQLDVMRFYRWRRRLLSRSGDTAGDGFVPIRFSGEGGRCGITVVIGQHLRLELSAGFDQQELLRAVRALGVSAPC